VKGNHGNDGRAKQTDAETEHAQFKGKEITATLREDQTLNQ